jgi:membrane-associated phospholipid phosphatase
MKEILKQNKIFLAAYILFLFLGIGLRLQSEKGDLIFYFAAHRTAFLDTFFGFATKLGELGGYILVALGALLLRQYREGIFVAVLGGASSLVAAILKNIFQQPRPKPYFQQLGRDITEIAVVGHPLLESQKSSFPSGHTIAAFAFFTALAIFSKSKVLKVFWLLLAVIVGLSRIYLVHHFLEDVLLGSFVGVALAFGLWALSFRIFRF